MIPVRLVLPFALLLACSGCQSTPAAAPPPPSLSGIELFTRPSQGLHVEADLALGELLARYTGSMGWTLEASEELRKGLAEWHCNLDRPLDVAPQQVHAFVESILRAHELFLEFAHASPPVVLRVITPASSTNLTRVLVPAAEVPRWREHAAHFIATDVRLRGVDAKQLVAGLHFLFSEPALVRIVQADDQGLLAVSGPATDIANLLQIVANIDRAGALPTELPRMPGEASHLLELLHDPREPLRLQGDAQQGLSIDELLGKYASLMGWQLLISPDVREFAKSRLPGFAAGLEVPAADVHTFVEGLLRSYGFVLRFAHAEEPIVLEVGSVHTANTGPQPGLAPLVQPEDLARWANHPCFLVQTQVRLPGVDVRKLAESMRGQFSEFRAQQLVALGDEQLLLAGFGADVSQWMPVLRALVEDAGGRKVAEPPDTTSSSGLELFATPAAGLHLEKPERWELKVGDVLDQYAQLLGWSLLVDPETRDQLRSLRCSFALPLDVPAERVHAFVESLAQANDFVFSFAHARDPVLLEVRSRNVAGRGNPRKQSRVIPAADLPRWSAHPAFLVSTVVDLPGVDVRTLSNSLRQMFSDQQTQQIIPLGNSNGLLVTGFGSDVAALATLFRSLADSAAGVHAPLPAPSAGHSVLDLLVAPAYPLHLQKPDQGELTLHALVEAYTRLMGWRVLVGPDTSNQLRTIRCGFALPVDVPPENVHAFVEGVLRANDFVVHFVHTDEPILLGVTSTNVAGMGSPRQDARMVPAADLPRWAGHPGFLVTTCLDLPGIDVRTLSNSMRQMFSDQQTQQIIPVGNSDGLIVTGFGSDVANIAEMLRSLADAAAGVHAALPPLAVTGSGIELLVPPAKALHLEKPERHELKLIELFDAYAQLMGWRLLVDPDTGNQLRTLECGLALPLDVAPEQVHTFVEGLARSKDLVLTFVHTRDPVLLNVSSTNVVGRGNPRKDAGFVHPSELPRWAGHPAFLISTLVELPGVDVRTLSNSLRQLFSDQQTQQIVPVGNTDGLIVTGFATDIVNLVSSLAELGRGGQGLKPPALPTASLADRARLFPLGVTGFTLEAPEGREPAPIEVLEAFAKWTQRPIEISAEARAALETGERRFSEPAILSAELAYPYVGLLLERAHCTLSPVPTAAPLKWVVDVARLVKSPILSDLPTIPFDDLSAWSGYCATPFRSHLRLPDTSEPKRVAEVLRWVVVRRPGCEVQLAGDRQIMIVGTPQQIQAVAYAILQACEPGRPR